jgi:hypothetical protein
MNDVEAAPAVQLPSSSATAPAWATHYVIACCAVIGGVLAYCASDFADWPKLTIAPLTGALTVVSKTNDGGITYWGSLLWGLGGAAISGAGGLGCARWLVDRRTAMQLLGAWAVTALALASLYIVWALWPL